MSTASRNRRAQWSPWDFSDSVTEVRGCSESWALCLESVGTVEACSAALIEVGVVGGFHVHDILSNSRGSVGREGNKNRDEHHSG
jgi:hypothetical protein